MTKQVANVDELAEARANETRRRYYLQALGVDLYLPRAPLPGAKPAASVQSLVITGGRAANLTQEASIQESACLTQAPSKQASPKQILPKQIPAKPAPSTKEAPGEKVGIDLKPKQGSAVSELEIGVDTGKAEPIQFILRAWLVAKDILVIDSRDPELALPTDALLRNMMLALGYKKSELGKSETLRWPLTQFGNSGHSEDDARAMVRAFIEAQMQQQAFTTVLLLGSSAQRFSLSAQQLSAEQITGGQQVGSDVLWQTTKLMDHCDGVLLPSLAELLQNPALKKNTWHSIKHLHRSRNE